MGYTRIKKILAGVFVGGFIFCTSMPSANASELMTYTKNNFNGNSGSYYYLKDKAGGTILSAKKESSTNPAAVVSGIWDVDGNNKMNDWYIIRMRPVDSSGNNVSDTGYEYSKINIDNIEWSTIYTKKEARAKNETLKVQVLGNSSKGGKISGKVQFN